LRATNKAAIIKALRHSITILIVAQLSSRLSRYIIPSAAVSEELIEFLVMNRRLAHLGFPHISGTTASSNASKRSILMHFVFLVPISGAALWFLFFVVLAEAAPALVGAIALIIFLAFIAWLMTVLQLWGSVGGVLALILAIAVFSMTMKWLSIFWSRIQGYPSKEAQLSAIALADLRQAEARADSSALKANAAHEKAIRSKSPLARYRASSTQVTALHHERIVLEKKKAWEQAEAQAVRKSEDAAEKVRTKADAEAELQRQSDLARETVKARAERAKTQKRTGHSSAQDRTEPPVVRPPD
jgi:hypothetical protein